MKTLLKGATVIDGSGGPPLSETAVLIEDAFIIEVGVANDLIQNSETVVVDLDGKWLLPGLINMHDHLMLRDLLGPARKVLEKDPVERTLVALRNTIAALRRGWTTVRDMGATDSLALQIREVIKQGDLPGPRVLAVGSPICVTGGHGNYVCIEADGVDACRKAARGQLKLGADFVKVMASHDPYRMPGPEQTRPEMSLEEIRAVFDEATRWGKRTACHVMGSTAIANVLDAGGHILDHGVYLNDALAERMAAAGAVLCPTLSAYDRQTMNPRRERGEQWAHNHSVLVEPHERGFQAAVRAGVKIVNGTDTTGIYAEEVELMRLGGMSAMDSLRACTSTAAEALGLEDEIGTIRAGMAADLVILNTDPLGDPYALEDVHMVFRAGQSYAPRDLLLLENTNSLPLDRSSELRQASVEAVP